VKGGVRNCVHVCASAFGVRGFQSLCYNPQTYESVCVCACVFVHLCLGCVCGCEQGAIFRKRLRGVPPPSVRATFSELSDVMCNVLQSIALRVGQNRIYAPYMTVHLVISLPKMLYIPHIRFWPTLIFLQTIVLQATTH